MHRKQDADGMGMEIKRKLGIEIEFTTEEARLLVYALHDLRDSQAARINEGEAFGERSKICAKMGKQIMDELFGVI